MAGEIQIDRERCKGCGLCIQVCPRQSISLSQQANRMGYLFAEPCGSGCTGCALCALMCPDVAIEVYRDGGSVVAGPDDSSGRLEVRAGG